MTVISVGVDAGFEVRDQDLLLARVLAAFFAAAERPAAPLVRAAFLAAAERELAVRPEALLLACRDNAVFDAA
jgi:hypothetical protein